MYYIVNIIDIICLLIDSNIGASVSYLINQAYGQTADKKTKINFSLDLESFMIWKWNNGLATNNELLVSDY